MLSPNDGAVLQQLFDPESATTPELLIDASLPKDPHYEQAIFAKISDEEKAVILQVEAAMSLDCLAERRAVLEDAIRSLQTLLKVFPKSAALNNDLAQAIRLRYGSDTVSKSLVRRVEASVAACQALTALDNAVNLLSPHSPLLPMSPVQCRTLAQAHMQRGAMRHGAVKHLPLDDAAVIPDSAPAFTGWSRTHLEDAASRDFFLGGRYGNEIGKALAVHINPTAKLCGQMVQDAMRREFALGSASNTEMLSPH